LPLVGPEGKSRFTLFLVEDEGVSYDVFTGQ
jgi:hypothetical protein